MRIRLLPILMFALAGTITIKVGAVWNAIEVSVGRESLAQAQPQPAPQPAAPANSATQARPVSQQAATTPTATTPGTSAPATSSSPATPAATTPTTSTPAATPPAAVTSTAPASSGTQPPPQVQSTASTPEDAVVNDPFDYTDEEVDVLQQLAKRREELDLRARQLDEREALIQAAEQRMDQKMAELKALQAMVEDLLKTRSEQEEAELKSLVKMYENMKPKAAAKVFEEMDMDVLLDVVERMNERKVAPILALVTPTRAKEITFELAQRRQLPVPQ